MLIAVHIFLVCTKQASAEADPAPNAGAAGLSRGAGERALRAPARGVLSAHTSAARPPACALRHRRPRPPARGRPRGRRR